MDDLARWSLKHGIRIDWADVSIGELELTYATGGIGEPYVGQDGARVSGWWIHSFDDDVEAWGCEEHGELRLSELSNHQRIEIMGARSPDLAQMLRVAFLAGVSGTSQGWNGEWPLTDESRADFARQADDYAAKIMGGQG